MLYTTSFVWKMHDWIFSWPEAGLRWASALYFIFIFPSSCSDVLSNLKAEINKSKEMKVAAVRPLILAAEENLHNMTVDLDKVVTKVWKNLNYNYVNNITEHQSFSAYVHTCPQVQAAESEAKIVSQYSELLKEAKQQFQREVNSLTPEIQANWKGLSKTTHRLGVSWSLMLIIECEINNYVQ